jgi:hypothetical protein
MTLPRRSASQRVGELGESLAQTALTRFAVTNRLEPDVGLDFLCHLETDGQVTPHPFFVQVKTARRRQGDKLRRRLKPGQVHLYATTPVPTYFLVIFLEPEPEYFWFAVHHVFKDMGITVASIAHLDNAIDVVFDLKKAWTNDSIEAVIASVREQHELGEQLERIRSALGELPDGRVANHRASDDLHAMSSLLYRNSLYLTRDNSDLYGRLLEVLINTWERMESRFGWGYPVGVVKIGLQVGSGRALTAALKALLYMESDITYSEQDTIRATRAAVALHVREEALFRTLQAIHYTPYTGDVMNSDLLGNKLALLVLFLFEPECIVPALKKAAMRLVEWKQTFTIQMRGKRATYDVHLHGDELELEDLPDKVRQGVLDAIRSRGQRDAEGVVWATIDRLRFVADRRINQPAWHVWEERILTKSWVNISYGWTNEECKANIISQHSLWEEPSLQTMLTMRLDPRSIPRRCFEDLSVVAQDTVTFGLKEHTSPAVRLDCLELYGKEKGVWADRILQHIGALRQEAPDQQMVDILQKLRERALRIGQMDATAGGSEPPT